MKLSGSWAKVPTVSSTKLNVKRLEILVSHMLPNKLFLIVAIKKFKESDEDEIAKKTIMREVKMLRLLKY